MIQCTNSQFAFMPVMSTTDVIFTRKQTIEKHGEGQTNVIVTFLDLEKAFDRLPRGAMEILKGTKWFWKVH